MVFFCSKLVKNETKKQSVVHYFVVLPFERGEWNLLQNHAGQEDYNITLDTRLCGLYLQDWTMWEIDLFIICTDESFKII